jgi:hypothetical protein
VIAGLTSAQVLIAEVARGLGEDTAAGRLVFGLHAVNGLVILAVAGAIVRQARALSRSGAALDRVER